MIHPETRNCKVTYVVPSYNHAAFLTETIKAIWSQTHQEIELIVIDDGSTDASAKILEELRLTSPVPMTVIVRENRGLNRTLNEGLELAKGKYFALCASDDCVLPQHATRLVAELEAADESVGFAYGDVEFMTYDGKRTGRRQLQARKPRSGNIFDDIIMRRYFPQGSANLYSTAALRGIGGFDEQRKGEGLSLYLRLTKAYRAAYVDEALSLYRLNENGLNADISGREEELLDLMEEHLPRGPTNWWKRRAIRSAFYLSCARSYYSQRNFHRSCKMLVQSSLAAPRLRQVELLARLVAQQLINLAWFDKK